MALPVMFNRVIMFVSAFSSVNWPVRSRKRYQNRPAPPASWDSCGIGNLFPYIRLVAQQQAEAAHVHVSPHTSISLR